jgi:hypothetical protein
VILYFQGTLDLEGMHTLGFPTFLLNIAWYVLLLHLFNEFFLSRELPDRSHWLSPKHPHHHLWIVSHVADDLFPGPCCGFPALLREVLDQVLCLICVYYTWQGDLLILHPLPLLLNRPGPPLANLPE